MPKANSIENIIEKVIYEALTDDREFGALTKKLFENDELGSLNEVLKNLIYYEFMKKTGDMSMPQSKSIENDIHKQRDISAASLISMGLGSIENGNLDLIKSYKTAYGTFEITNGLSRMLRTDATK